MHYLQSVIILLIWTFPSSLASTDVTYEELLKLNATCDLKDTCTVRDVLDSLEYYTCHCGAFCSDLGTCCVDSPYRDIEGRGERPSCRAVYGEHIYHYFMVDTCSSHLNTDEHTENLCKRDLNQQDNITSIVPVTSLSSNVTYKNYYCFKCNEVAENFLLWNVYVENDTHSVLEQDAVYEAERKSWVAPSGEAGEFIPVSVFIELPSKIYDLLQVCLPNAISTCSKLWENEDVASKCSKYTSVIHIGKVGENIRYRNPHCALCNFENLEYMNCGSFVRPKILFPSIAVMLGHPSWETTHKDGRCDDETVWDTVFFICRALICPLEHDLRNGICVKKQNDRCDDETVYDHVHGSCYPPLCHPGYVYKNRMCVKNKDDGCDGETEWDPFYKECRVLICDSRWSFRKNDKCVDDKDGA